ncbi:MAG: endonuclease domain-containing protein, partial [Rhodocyclaceae bacterium]|nr:endonuclease domain-containing protein [Rhodocyclaceae bacterium]
GIRVLRFWANEVLHDTEDVLETIWHACVQGGGQTRLPSPPSPLPEGEGKGGSPYLASAPSGQGPTQAWQWPREILDLFPDRLVDSE